MSTEATCVVCSGCFPVARMDIAEHGHVCFGCAQQAVIRQHEHAAAQQLHEHNRNVLLLVGLRFWKIVSHCPECGEQLPRGPGLFSLALSPSELQCARCGTKCGLSFVHRANWSLALLLRPAIPVAIASRYSELAASHSATTVVVQLAIALIFAFIGAALLAVPVTFVLDRTGPVSR